MAGILSKLALLLLLAAVLSPVHCTDVTIPADAANLDSWFSANIKSFDAGMANLDGRVVGSEKGKRIITVGKDGNADFKTVTDAIKSVPMENSRRTIIKIGPGVYKEKVIVDRSRPFITFYGDPKAMPTISFDGTAAKYGTIESASVAVESNYFMAVNIIFENTAPKPVLGVEGAQAVAFRISGDKAAFYNCKFYGYQDTLCDDVGDHFFKDCFIQGTVDFIFGNGRSIYLNCELHSVGDGITAITAQARDSVADKSGYSFIHCNITGTGNITLSRAWKHSSRAVFAYTYMGSLVNPKGWDNMGHPDFERSVFYAEYKCKGPGSNTSQRAGYGRLLNDDRAKPFLSIDFIHGSTWLLPPPSV